MIQVTKTVKDEFESVRNPVVGMATLHEHQRALLTLLNEYDRVCKKLDIPYTLFAGTLLGSVRHQGFIPWDDDLDVLMLRPDYERFLKEAEDYFDIEKFFLQKEFSAHWPMFFSKLRLNGTACLEKFHPRDQDMHQGVYIDIFPCDYAAPTEFGRKIQYLASKVVIAKSLDARGYDTDSRIKKCFILLCRVLPASVFLNIVQRKKSSNVLHSFLAGAASYKKNIYPARWFSKCVDMTFEDGRFPVAECYDDVLRQLYGDYMRVPSPKERVCKEHAILVDLIHSYEEYRNYRDGMTFDVKTRSIR